MGYVSNMRIAHVTLGVTLVLGLAAACTVSGQGKGSPSGDGDDTGEGGLGGLGHEGSSDSSSDTTDGGDGDGDGDEKGSGGTTTAGSEGCAPGTAVSGVTASGETICSYCEEGEYCAGGEAEVVPCGDETWDHDDDPKTKCVDWTDCEPGQYVETPGRATNDRACEPCENGYSEEENADECQDWTECEPGQYVTEPGGPTKDQSCDDCATGFTNKVNQESCTAWSLCSGPVSDDGSSTDDRVCTHALAITGGTSHSCALFEGGVVWCWGSNQYGQIGVAGTDDRPGPLPVPALSGVTQLDAGMNGSCSLTGSTVKCWGSTGGLTTTALRGVSGITDATSIATGAIHSCAALADGRVKCWGSNEYDQLTGSGDATTPRLVMINGTLQGVTKVSSSFYHTCALGSDLSVSCWGRNDTFQIGNSLVPAITNVMSSATSIAIGSGGTCVTRTNGTVSCWGSYNAGENTSVRNIPEISSGAVQVVGGEKHWCVLFDDGTVNCWGEQSHGQLGDGVIGNSSYSPVAVKNLEDVTELGAGANHTCAIVESGDIYCWGRNDHGQLGDGTKLNRSKPVKVVAAE